MKRIITSIILVAALALAIYGAPDLQISWKDNVYSVYLSKVFPTNTSYPVGCLQAESSLTVNATGSTSIGTVPTGAVRVMIVADKSIKWNENSATATAANDLYALATSTIYFFAGTETELGQLTFCPLSTNGTPTAYLRFY